MNNIRHPISFWVMILALIVTAAISVSFSTIHVVGLMLDIGLIVGVRFLAHWEGQREIS